MNDLQYKIEVDFMVQGITPESDNSPKLVCTFTDAFNPFLKYFVYDSNTVVGLILGLNKTVVVSNKPIKLTDFNTVLIANEG